VKAVVVVAVAMKVDVDIAPVSAARPKPFAANIAQTRQSAEAMKHVAAVTRHVHNSLMIRFLWRLCAGISASAFLYLSKVCGRP
jgi:hypothetical protein